ncbi:protein H2 [BeAn 58058 virus]|uniref:protein H2 n=1 Tax=BeAn 58058 virus TaxID=67082 RepID=UPI00090AC726|nr:protein H2 [BeAn 58058 virus]APG58290.1 protein H2 [BeAn 58058 virus]
MDKTTLNVNGVELEYFREKEKKSIHVARKSTLCFFVLIFTISILLLWFQISDNSIFSELLRYTRIKNSVKGWRPLVESKSILESDRGRLMASGRDYIFDFNCVDYGEYFIPVRLDKKTYLPQAIRRGVGDGWVIRKANKVDLSAHQFCEHLINTHSDNVITCGNDMMDKVGYSGYFAGPHWCSDFYSYLN